LIAIGDINQDYNPATGAGGVTNRDIQALLNMLAAGASSAIVPEPRGVLLALIGLPLGFGIARWRVARVLQIRYGASALNR
jgi:hypothetical protein